MKTKIFAIALALSLAACLTACGQPSSASPRGAARQPRSSVVMTHPWTAGRSSTSAAAFQTSRFSRSAQRAAPPSPTVRAQAGANPS